MRRAPYQIRASDLEDERIKAELARKSPCRTKTTIRNRCFLTFEKGVHNESVFATSRRMRPLRLRIPMKPATDSDLKPASHSDFIPATLPI